MQKIGKSGKEDDILVSRLATDGTISLYLNGKPVSPDYRLESGVDRSLIRRFDTLGSGMSFFSSGTGKHPDASFLRFAASAGRLVDDEDKAITVAEGIHPLCLYAAEEDGKITIHIQARDSGETIRLFAGTLALCGTTLYETGGLGADLTDLMDYEGETVSRENLPFFFSMVSSRYDDLDIRLEGYQSVVRKPVEATPALIFQDIDEYGYLHVMVDSYMDGFAPGVLTANNIIKSVTIQDEDRLLVIRDITFPGDAAATFRRLLGKNTKNNVYEENGQFIIEGGFAQEFIGSHFDDLVASFAIYQPEVLAKYKIRYHRPSVHFSFSSGIDFLEGDASVSIGDTTMSLDEFLTAYRRNNGYILLGDKSRNYIEASFIKRLERITRTKNGKSTISAYDLPYIDSMDDFEVDGEAVERFRTFYQGFNTIGQRGYRTKIKTSTLRGYQEEGYRWLRYLHDNSLGGCLADEMGLGKTVQIIALLNDVSAARKDKPSLLIAPRSIIYNWLSEIDKFGIGLRPFVYYGQDRDANDVKQLKGGIIISSYATIRNDIEKLADIDFDYIILDESQSVKHFNTRTAQAILNLKSEHRIAVSGTPIENDLGELFSLFRFLNPSLFPSMSAFTRDYVKPITADDDKDASAELRMKIYPFIMRRMKRDVLKDLPEKTEQTAYVDMQAEHWAYYEERRSEMKARIDGKLKKEGREKSSLIILQALTELRQIASLPEGKMLSRSISSKREYLRNVLPEITAAGHKALIFTSFLDTVEKIGEDLEALGIGYVTMTGATRDRESLIQRFQRDPETQVFLMTLKTGGVGLNLTAADYVFIFDPWWNGAAEDQAINRTHRIGQINPVFCYRLIAKGTIEEKILQLQEKKRELSSALITSDAGALKSLSDEELEELLG